MPICGRYGGGTREAGAGNAVVLLDLTLTAALNYVDDAALSLAEAYQKATQRLGKEVFHSGRAAG
ncbi:hypothetical protein [Streptomyces sp. NPDC058279]|uniref:hypothetical protein n=1 Tax=Streptomyces sp. NPDC058279 TaxID=3346418 RepID=UPI0036EDC1B6